MNKRFWLITVFVVLALVTGGCDAGAPGGIKVAGSTGVRAWIDRPFNGASVPLAPYTLRAHARDASGAGVQRIAFLVNSIALGSVTTDPSQPLVSAEFGWNPSVPGQYQIQVQAFNSAGSALSEIAVVCVGPDCQPATLPTETPAPSKNLTPTFTPSPPAVTSTLVPQTTCTGTPVISAFTASPSTLTAAGTTTLSWSASNADRVELAGTGVVDPTGSRVVPVSSTATFNLVAYCGGKEHFISKSVTVTVSASVACKGLPVVTFSASPTIIDPGGSATLTWAVTNATEIALVGTGIVGPSGSRVVRPGATSTYTLTAFCDTKANLIERSVTVTVRSSTPTIQVGCSGSPSIAFLNVSPATITAGGSAVLSWGAVTNADSVSIDQGIGVVPAPGSRSVSPGGTTTYTMTARCGNNVATKQTTITVNAAPPPISPTSAPKDTTPPAISGIKPNSSTLTNQPNCTYPTALIVTANISDASGIASVQLFYRLGSTASWSSVAMNPAGSGSYSGTANVGSLFKTSGTIEYYITARDNLSNSSNSGTSTVSYILCPG